MRAQIVAANAAKEQLRDRLLQDYKAALGVAMLDALEAKAPLTRKKMMRDHELAAATANRPAKSKPLYICWLRMLPRFMYVLALGKQGGRLEALARPCLAWPIELLVRPEVGRRLPALIVCTQVGKLTADGKTVYANQGKAKQGTILYRIVWKDYPPDDVWYEPRENVGVELIEQYEARVAAEAAEEEAAAQEEAEL